MTIREQLENLGLDEKYRPRAIEDCILPKALKQSFQQYVDAGKIPNLLLVGPPGCGKTSVAKALVEQVGGEYYFLNASLEGNIDTLRTTITDFASTASFSGTKKYVILDEADYLNPNSTQPSLRGFIQEMAANCGFILTGNYSNKIIEPLRSRLAVMDFSIMASKKVREAAAVKFFDRLKTILDTEQIKYEEPVLVGLLHKFAPDWRRVLTEIDGYTQGDHRVVDAGILKQSSATSYDPLIQALRSRNFTRIRTWVGENVDIDTTPIFRALFDHLAEIVTAGSAGDLVVLLADYQYKSAFVADQQINMTACLVEIATNCEMTGSIE